MYYVHIKTSIQIAVCHTLQHPFVLELLKRLIEGSYPMLEVSVQVSGYTQMGYYFHFNRMEWGGNVTVFLPCTVNLHYVIEHDAFKIYSPSQFELKKSLVDHLVHLLSCGHILPVVDYVAQCTEMESLDQTHIRHFVAEVRTAGTSTIL